jgi:ribonuclease J
VDSETGELVSSPDLISRGFVYERESESLLDAARRKVEDAIRTLPKTRGRTTDWGFIKNKVRDTLSEYIFTQLKRRPMILPVVVEV